MPKTAHNPDQYMLDLRQILAQGRKRIAFLVGAGAPCSIKVGGNPLIPAIAPLTEKVRSSLAEPFKEQLTRVAGDLSGNPNIEKLLSRIRALADVLLSGKLDSMDGAAYKALEAAVAEEIANEVSVRLPVGSNPYVELASWIGGAKRSHSIEIFTPNYDRLFEEALERNGIPFFDGFSGSVEPFFDSASVLNEELPSRWVRVWKIHGSIGWGVNKKNEVIKVAGESKANLIYPTHLKYDQVQKQPYTTLFERLRRYLLTPDTVLVCSGFSFADAHITAVIDEALSANRSAAVLCFQYLPIAHEPYAPAVARRRANMSVYGPDGAVVNGVHAPWEVGELPGKDWAPIRESYWDSASARFLLGDFAQLVRFFAGSSTRQISQTVGSAGATA